MIQLFEWENFGEISYTENLSDNIWANTQITVTPKWSRTNWIIE